MLDNRLDQSSFLVSSMERRWPLPINLYYLQKLYGRKLFGMTKNHPNNLMCHGICPLLNKSQERKKKWMMRQMKYKSKQTQLLMGTNLQYLNFSNYLFLPVKKKKSGVSKLNRKIKSKCILIYFFDSHAFFFYLPFIWN